ncbi:hypothetical protein [Blastococcus brunescens]|uniref:Uncharacterized protein n=1 Tax=Blastococcus brunescens TaxID=1564165 RepID=A0ABZ1AWQ9_9ACTN|nr:hypothetical protein [Blastococcus sp. BMG 8361]WRL62945.1 hypothetical protein U6N30_24260 [Blastococcus sp. BMG 8361]
MLTARWPRTRRTLIVGALAAVVVPLTVALPGAQADDGTERLVGELVQAWAEHFDPADAADHADDGDDAEDADHALLSWVETAPGEAVRVATEDVADIPVGSTVAVTVGDEVADAASEDQGQDPAREVLSATVLAAAPQTSRRWPRPAP